MDNPSYKNGQASQENLSPRLPGSQGTKVKIKNVDGNVSKVHGTFSSIDSKAERNSVTLPPIMNNRATTSNVVQDLHSPTEAAIRGGEISMSSPQQEIEIQPKIENKKSEFEATGTSNMFKNTLPVTNQESEAPMIKKEKSKSRGQDDAEEEVDEPEKLEEEPELAKWYDQQDMPDDPSLFFVHNKQHKFSKRSLFLLNNNNRFRRAIVFLITHKAFDQIIVFLILINALLLGIKDYTDPDNLTPINQFVDQCEPVFVWAFTIEFAFKVIGMGFFLDEGSYLRDAWNWLDFVVVLSSLLTEIPQMKSVSGMRTFRLMRPLRSLTTMPSMKILISTLLASVAQLGGVLVLAMFFFMIFAILGISLWVGSIHKRCRLTEFPVDGDWVTDPDMSTLCSSTSICPSNRWCGSLKEAWKAYELGDERYRIDYSIECEDNPDCGSKVKDLLRDSRSEDLNFGFSSFDNIVKAFLTIFQCVTLEGWIDITNIYEHAYLTGFVRIYFLLCIIVCSFFVLNLTIAVMLLKYEELDKSEKSSEHLEDLRVYGNEIGEDGLPPAFTEFIIDQDNINISPKGIKILKNQKEDNSWRSLIKSTATFDPEDGYYHNSLTRVCFYVVNSPIFNGFILLVIIMNTLVLSVDKFPAFEEEAQDFFKVLNVIFTIVFTFEVVVKIIGVGARGFCSDRFNIFDAVIVLISLIEMFIEATSSGHEAGGSGGAISAMRALRLFRVFKLFKSGDLRTLLDGIAFTILAVGDYCILLGLFIYVFALLGMSMFAGKVKFDDDGEIDIINGETPRANFDKLLWACVSVFFVMIGENWNSTMYDHMRGTSDLAAIYFIALVVFGNIIMLNLFLAILLGNFDRARNFGEKKKIFDAFDSMTKMGYNLNISIAYLFDDQDLTRFIEDKVLQEGKEDSSPKKKILGEDENIEKIDYNHTEKEVRQLYCAMTMGNIEQILNGEKSLDEEPWEDFAINDIPEHQREKTVEILNYIKRQKNLRTQRLEFHDQLKKTQDQRDALDKMAIEEEIVSSESDASTEALTVFEKILDHFQNSSLLIFHQNNIIRQWCQRLIQNDDEESGVGPGDKQKQVAEMQGMPMNSQGNDGQVFSPNNNKVGSIDDNLDVNKRSKPMNKETNQKNTQQLQFLSTAKSMKKNPNQSGASMSKSMMKKSVASDNQITPVKIFEGIIMTLIIISSIMLVVDNPFKDPGSDQIIFVGYLDNCFTILFTIEAVIKIIAMGFMFNNQTLKDRKIEPYIRNAWNILDIIVVAASLLDFVILVKSSQQVAGNESSAMASNLKSVKALRALRALRPLRMISRNQGMKLIVNALLASLPSMLNVTIVCFLFLLIFAIVGVSFFKGAFGFCELDDEDLMSQVVDRLDCEKFGGIWNNPTENFDNAIKGLLTLLEMMTTEGWIDIMNAGIDSVAPDHGIEQEPVEHNNDWYLFYFIMYMIFGSQFILNLFVGVIMDNFNKIKDKQEWGSLFVTDDQRAWIDAQRLGLGKHLQKKIDPPPGWRSYIFKLVNHAYFEATIMFFIVFNTAIMASRHVDITPQMLGIFENLNYLFAAIFNIEMVLKLIGLGWQYFYSGWNVFDCLVVIGTDAGIILNFTTTGSSISTATTVVRAFRIMRIVRLIRSQENIKIILDTLVNIIPSITNFITLMFLMIFIYAALGINLFGLTRHKDLITDQNNFQDIGTSIIFLFRCATGEDWNKIMHLFRVTSDSGECIDDQDYHVLSNNSMVTLGCGNNVASLVYFLSFLVLISWLILNLSVAAVIEGLENARQENTGLVAGDDVQGLIDAWMEYDAKATGWISVTDFICLIIELPPPFGDEELTKEWQKDTKTEFESAKRKMYNKNSYYVNEDKRIIVKNKDILKILKSYKITTYEQKNHQVHFKDIYQKLIKKVFLEEIEDFEISKYLKTKMKNQWLEKHKKVKELQKTGFKAHQGFASKIISEYAKRHRFQKENPTQSKSNKAQYEQYANYKNIRKGGDIQKSSLTSEDIKKIKESTNPNFKIGFAEEESPSLPRRQGGGRNTYTNEINLAPEQENRPPGHQRIRQKNKDENPQEFEEVGSQEEQSEERAIEYVNQIQAQIARQDPPSERQADSMASKEEDLQVRIKMGQSITDSQVNKSDSNMLLLTPKEEENEDGLIPSKSGNLDAVHRRGSNMSQTQAHQRSRSHQNNNEVNRERATLRESGSSNANYAGNRIPVADMQMQGPPKTANPGQGRKKNAELNEGEGQGESKPANNFFD